MGGQLSRLRRSRRREQQAIPSNVTISVSVVAKSTATTNWKVTSSPPSLEVSINGGTYQRVVLKGVCYSPCPLNGSNWYGPNIGDWFWDSFSGITGWEALWKRDFPNIRAPSSTSICANTIRVYSIISNQLGTFPSLGQYFTHTSFLDMCWNDGINPLYVLVGFPMPQLMFWRNDYYDASPAQRNFWENVFVNTVKQVSSHPAVLGFVIQNELDSNLVTWPNEDKSNLQDVEFWWSQVKHFSNVAKTNAPNKLVGMAVHDDPFIPGKAAGYMARGPSIDYWGVNTYQPQELLDHCLRQFWDLESMGIQPRESSVYDKFENGVVYNGERYQVSLPWKESHPPLPDNYDLALRRLNGLLKRLRQSPAILQQ